MKIFILLDVDGVMIAYPNGPGPQPPFFNSEPVEAVKMILACDPRVEIILSSSMRVFARERFDKMFESAGLPLSRIVGQTHWEGSLKPNRQREVKDFILRNYNDAIILPIDDEVMEEVLYMKTNAATGLTIRDAEVCIEHIKNYTKRLPSPHLQPCHFGLGLSYIRPVNDEL